MDASITINQAFAERYQQELGFAPMIVYNAPNRSSYPSTWLSGRTVVDQANVSWIGESQVLG